MAGTPASRCPPNLLGGSLRTTTPGCIRPLFFPGSVQLRFDSPLLSKTTAPSSSRVSGNGTETSTSNDAAVQLHDQCSAGQSSGVDAADRKITESKTPYGHCQSRLSNASTVPCSIETTAHEEEERDEQRDDDVSDDDLLKRNNTEDRRRDESHALPYNLTPSCRSQTLPGDVRRLQSFQMLSAADSSASVNDGVFPNDQPRPGVAGFFGRVSLKSLRRLLGANAAAGTRDRSAVSVTNSSPGDGRPDSTLPAASAGCGASSNDTMAAASSAVRSPLRRWLGRRRRHQDVTRRRCLGISTTTASVTESATSAATANGTGREATSNAPSVPLYVVETGSADGRSRAATSRTARGYAESPKRTAQTSAALRLLQPPTTLSLLSVPSRAVATSPPAQWKLCSRRLLSSYESTDSIGQCSLDSLASTADAG